MAPDGGTETSVSHGNGFDARGEIARLEGLLKELMPRVADVKERVSYVEAGLPRIEQVQAEVIVNGQKQDRNHALTRDVRDQVIQVAAEAAEAVEKLSKRCDQQFAKIMEKLDMLIDAKKPKKA